MLGVKVIFLLFVNSWNLYGTIKLILYNKKIVHSDSVEKNFRPTSYENLKRRFRTLFPESEPLMEFRKHITYFIFFHDSYFIFFV